MLKLYDLTTEYKREPLGLDEAQPRFGWTNYRKRLQYQTCAVTLHSGKNHLALTLANGWYKGKLGFMPQPNHYGDTTAALAALCITYEDGHEEWLGTDESWLCTTGAVQAAEIYDGETQDFTADPAAPQPARLFDYGFDTLIFQLPGRFLVDNFCRADGGEHRCGRSVSTAPEAAYLLPGLGANGVVGGLQVVEPVLHSNPSFKCQ